VGLAAYDRSDRELRVDEVGIDPTSACIPAEIADGLLDALELGCVAGSVRRLVLLPRTDLMDDVLHRRGYSAIAKVTSGTQTRSASLSDLSVILRLRGSGAPGRRTRRTEPRQAHLAGRSPQARAAGTGCSTGTPGAVNRNLDGLRPDAIECADPVDR
jgi:hypothetical protein